MSEFGITLILWLMMLMFIITFGMICATIASFVLVRDTKITNILPNYAVVLLLIMGSAVSIILSVGLYRWHEKLTKVIPPTGLGVLPPEYTTPPPE